MKILFILLLLFSFNISQGQEYDENDLDMKISGLSTEDKIEFLDSITRTGNYESQDVALKFINYSIRFVRKNHLGESKLADYISRRGNLYRKQTKYVSALNDFKTVEGIYKKLRDYEGLEFTYTAFANIYTAVGDNVKAISFIYKVLRLAENRQNQDAIGIAFNSLANIHLSIQNYDSSLLYYKKSYQIYADLKSDYQQCLLLDNISMTYVKKDKIDSAYIYSKLARDKSKVLKDKYLDLQLMLNACSIEELLNHYDLLLTMAKEAKSIADSLGESTYQIYANANYANALHQNGKYQPAIREYRDVVSVAQPNQMYELLKEVYFNISETFGYLHQSDSALHYYKLSAQINDTLEKIKASEKVNELMARNQIEKKERNIQHIIELNNAEKTINLKEKEALKETHKWQRLIIIVSVIAIIITLVLIILISKRLNENKKLNSLMKEKNIEILQKNNSLHRSKQEIISSINYAKRIQYALLAHDELLKKNLPEHFVLFRPKDIVSGDFYWATEKLAVGSGSEQSDSFYLAVCDSTGHGVPGAFMSLLNISFLNEAINEKKISHAGEIFDHVRNRLIANMENAQDGMDAILVRLDFRQNEKKLIYAAANNAPVVIRNDEIIELPYDKMPIGKGEKKVSFQQFTFNLQKGDLVYLFTDGFADQFGGPKNKKYKPSTFNKLLEKVAVLKMEDQQAAIEAEFNSWKGQNEQVDDICIIGVRI